jgi:hypothetical protein
MIKIEFYDTVLLQKFIFFQPLSAMKLKKLRILLSASNVLGPANFSGNVLETLRFDSKSGSNSALLIPILNCYEKKKLYNIFAYLTNFEAERPQKVYIKYEEKAKLIFLTCI